MADRSVARRYAAAVMDLFVESGQPLDPQVADLGAALDALMTGEGELFRALCTPVFTLEERSGVLEAVLQRVQLRQLTTNLLRVLLAKGRMEILPDLVQLCRDLADEAGGRARVQVDTAEPLTPQLELEVRSALEAVTGKTVLLETRVQPELLGGMVARVGGKVYDASLRSRLHDLKNRLINAPALPEA